MWLLLRSSLNLWKTFFKVIMIYYIITYHYYYYYRAFLIIYVKLLVLTCFFLPLMNWGSFVCPLRLSDCCCLLTHKTSCAAFFQEKQTNRRETETRLWWSEQAVITWCFCFGFRKDYFVKKKTWIWGFIPNTALIWQEECVKNKKKKWTSHHPPSSSPAPTLRAAAAGKH